MNNSIINDTSNIFRKIVEIRRDIHKNPELGMCEFRTSQLILDTMENLGIEMVRCPSSTGVFGLLKGDQQGPTLGMRADMDALEVQEETDLSYQSIHKGIMHACGHDGHVAILLGAAMVLSNYKKNIKGQIKFIFQPAEEKSPEGGAQSIIKDGVLQNPNVDAMIGYHIFPQVPVNTVAIKRGVMTASSDVFQIEIHGKGGHPGLPHQSIDPILTTGHIITAIQSIVSRNIDPLDPAVISLGAVNGGSKHNIIPDKMTIKGTARTFSDYNRTLVEKRLSELVHGICSSMGTSATIDYKNGYPYLKNDDELVQKIEASLVDIFSKKNVTEMQQPLSGSEDFAYYAKEVPSAYFVIGGSFDDSQIYPNHHPKFRFNELALQNGVLALTKIALDFLK
ncbi:MAG: amidohydrolase [Tissierellales bacterium]|nr:amidohydrolase [Tissierellales bacterium]MBN2827334.1 amidohydrolase [Tissierellales bacterium]